MTRFTCSAPGKLFVSGEYAVLNGAPAIVTAVSRRAVASLVKSARDPSPVLKAVREHMTNYLGAEGKAETPLPLVQVESPGFQTGHHKIGLGSSSATTAAACGAYFEWAGLPIPENRKTIMELAIRAHRSAQGGKGSGADVAAATEGGTLVFSRNGVMEKISIDFLDIVVVWSGKAASTSALIESTRKLKQECKEVYATCFGDLTRTAEHIVDACRARDSKAVICAMEDYGSLMKKLGECASCPIVTKEHELIATIARRLGGAAKPSGAGGGDVAIGLFENRDDSEKFRSALTKRGFNALDLEIGAEGLRRDN